ncbi:MAG: FMN-binding protein [Lachnospiraceae bacterium]|nr:FMN-binding protein [Lachnospiraceae bacterium]
MGKQTISRTTLAKGVTACVVVAASLGIVQIGEYSINSSEETASTTVSSTTGTVAYTPGTYTATAAGIQSDVTVSCTFDEGSITSITVDVSGETAGLGADIGDEMIESFLAAQSSNVDGVSGATITSDALKEALEDCITQATGGSGDSDEVDEEATEASSSSDEEDADAAETEAADEAETDAVADTETDNIEGATEAAVDTSETETESEADSEVTAAASDSNVSSGSGTYTPGTYTAVAAGMESDVTVTVTVDETSILSLGIDVSGETDGIGAAIGPEISEQILNAQSADVDGVSGATVTSTAVKTALTNALDQAAGGSSDSTDDTDTAAAIAEGETEAAETETEAVETEAAEAETEAAETETAEAETEAAETETAEAETEAVETETETATTETAETETEAADEPAAIEGGSSFVPGTYTASAAGISSDVTVTCTFDETGLVSIEADVSGETSGIGADIGDTMIARVLTAQSSDVDGVSGATITSDAFKAAVADCMEQAGFVAEAAESETETEAAAETESTTSDDSDTELAAAPDAPFVPGTYTATAQGMESEITVNVTFDEYNIVAVGTWMEDEFDEVSADLAEEIRNQVLEIRNQVLDAQSAEIDGVSGATVTSTAVKEAVANCIAQAKADSEEAAAEEYETEIISEEETEDTATTESADGDETETLDEASLSSLYTAGIYSASAEGISSEVVVTVAFDDNSITSIGYDLSGETADIGALIGPEISGQILTAQSVEVDGVSGATITSDAFKAAVADCIAQAQAGSSDLVIIGGADGPTSIFLAGTMDEAETEQSETEDAQ